MRLTDGEVSNLAYDCTVDLATCTDADLWEISTSIVADPKFYVDPDWVARKGTLPVTGVMFYRYDRRRIRPRAGADF